MELTTTQPKQLVRANTGFGIEGLEEVPVSVLPVPFLRLVQPSSKKIEKPDGSEAQMGTYFYNDTQEEIKELNFVLLKAKVGKFEVIRIGTTDEKELKTQIKILGYDLDHSKVFLLTLSVMSISNFGKLVAQMKQQNVTKTWEYAIKATSTKLENDKGKFFIANFQLGEKVSEEKIKEMEATYKAFAPALNKDTSDEEVVIDHENLAASQTEATEVEVIPEPEDTSIPLKEEAVPDDDLPF